jgi:hypothetical protein
VCRQNISFQGLIKYTIKLGMCEYSKIRVESNSWYSTRVLRVILRMSSRVFSVARLSWPVGSKICRHEARVPILVRKYMSIPATQVRSERQFSAGSNTVTWRHQNLLPEHVEQLLFLHENLKVSNLT